MWINSYKIKKNITMPYYVIEHLRKLTFDLRREIDERLGNEYNVQLKFSVQSEAAYITIFYYNSSYSISIRSHATRVPDFDKAYYLNKYHTWNDFKNYFLKIELKKIKRILKRKMSVKEAT